jgi:hypothetical protein
MEKRPPGGSPGLMGPEAAGTGIFLFAEKKKSFSPRVLAHDDRSRARVEECILIDAQDAHQPPEPIDKALVRRTWNAHKRTYTRS